MSNSSLSCSSASPTGWCSTAAITTSWRHTGGLADSVQMWNPQTREGTGIVFNDFDTGGVRWAIDTALDLYKDQDAWRQIVRNGMAQDYSWQQQGRKYVQMYEALLG
jgi:starch synthase